MEEPKEGKAKEGHTSRSRAGSGSRETQVAPTAAPSVAAPLTPSSSPPTSSATTTTTSTTTAGSVQPVAPLQLSGVLSSSTSDRDKEAGLVTSGENIYFANFEQLGQDLSVLLSHCEHDVVFIVGSSAMCVTAHRLIMAVRCPYFRELFDRARLSNSPVCGPYAFRDFDVDSFINVLSYLYTGVLQLSEENVREVFHIAEVLSLKFLEDKCLDVLSAMSGALLAREKEKKEREKEREEEVKEGGKDKKEKDKPKVKEESDEKDKGKNKRKKTPRKKRVTDLVNESEKEETAPSSNKGNNGNGNGGHSNNSNNSNNNNGPRSARVTIIKKEGGDVLVPPWIDDEDSGLLLSADGVVAGESAEAERINKVAHYMMKDDYSRNKLAKFFGRRRDSLPLDCSLREIVGHFEEEASCAHQESWELSQDKLAKFFGRNRLSVPVITHRIQVMGGAASSNHH